MLILDGAQIDAQVFMPKAIECMRQAFSRHYATPHRQLVPVPGGNSDRLCLVMPCFDMAGGGAIKLSTVFPDNNNRKMPTIQGTLVVFSDAGTPIAMLDGGAVTRIRTAAASALASSYLSCHDSKNVLIIGTGELAPSMAVAHCAVRPIKRVHVWGRRSEAAFAAAESIRGKLGSNIEVVVASSLEEAAQNADIISCATSTHAPLLSGKWLKPGAFVDLVGSFSANKREADDEAIRRSKVFVDTFDGAFAEAGDVMQPLARGVISREHILGELSDLVCKRIRGRTSNDEITLFKSVGVATEDYALAQMLIETCRRES